MKTLKKLLYIIMAVAVLAVPVFGVQAAENDIPVTEQSGAKGDFLEVSRHVVTDEDFIGSYYQVEFPSPRSKIK